ncbi:hypothetical protein HMPREF9080_02882 [Cardiobacterium valvarum F0432]|uniref:Uncharacterized protein n=1 Tax=Cardiobacterium valvarum F0432 TaxID=797473 RepID=G9ZJB2_9GAMM|nr:hypothetical protein HMPREF9080_02882 [Cardiobacterium valvarum F0432]
MLADASVITNNGTIFSHGNVAGRYPMPDILHDMFMQITVEGFQRQTGLQGLPCQTRFGFDLWQERRRFAVGQIGFSRRDF